jgi:hypothetical protein
VKWVVGGCAVIAVVTFTLVYAAVGTLLDDWQVDWDTP